MPWYRRRWPSLDGLSWVGKLNYYVLQWTGWRLTMIFETDEVADDERPTRWTMTRWRVGTGWLP